VRDLRFLGEPLLAGAVWAVLALASDALRDQLGAVLLLWAPSGVAVAAFLGTRRSRWAILAAVLLPIQAVAVWLVGTPIDHAFAYSVASLVQSIIAAQLGIMALGGRRSVPRRFRQVGGLFVAAVLGALAGALVAIPFRAEQTLAEFAWWFLANVLGMLTVTPLLLLARQELGLGPKVQQFAFERSLVPFLLGGAVLALVALQVSQVALMPLLVAGIVLATVRYGQQASLLLILIYAAIGTWLSVVTGTPMPLLPMPAAQATLVLQSWLLAMLATVLPIAAMLLKRQELQYELQERNLQMQQSLMLFNLAEETAGIGRWRLNLVDGTQDWSPQMLEMNGLSRSLAPDPGDVRGRLPDGGEELFRQIARHRDEQDTYSFTYRVRPSHRLERVLRMAMRNEFDRYGKRVAVFGVAMDVTEQVRREEALDNARSRAMRLASEAQKLANTDPLTTLPNRRCTFDRLESMVVVAENCGSPLSAILFDIDHFKSVNDTHGHGVGDAVLQQVADMARAQSRRGDIVGRIGGEEFVWLVAGMSGQTVRQLAERLRCAVEKGLKGSNLPGVTISVGLAHFRPGDTCESLLARADAALYEAKGAGRNQVKRAA